MTELALNLTLESHPKNIAEVEPYVTQVVKKYEINQELYGNMLITLTEAVSNAIIHGNSAKAAKKVFVSTNCSQQKICFTVQDEGSGFDPDGLPDPTAPENILTPGGRGVFLMRQLSDAVTFGDDGRLVTLEFSLQ
ncbi:ATP-binding protein [Aureispira anguillae]|uniref:ATP-binding protein n=1 Tax=Aureispira anguillae TaxID=2864201 RepID=A0A915YIB9_9BACT|nr:ATP-binding protein [Aureispira anguillae]BDS13730.1 ATP-binding protein [Aureispira anguillae]